MSIQLAVRMSDQQLDDLDWIVVHLQLDSRAEGLRTAVELIKRELERQEIDRQYLAAYAEQPLTDDEIAEATRLSIESIAEEPWEKWW
jgi:hypothetical protein